MIFFSVTLASCWVCLLLNEPVVVDATFCGGTKELTWDCVDLGSGVVGVAVVAASVGVFLIGASNEGSSRMLPAPKFDLIGGGLKSEVESLGAGGFEFTESWLSSFSVSIFVGANEGIGLDDELSIFSNAPSTAGFGLASFFAGTRLNAGFVLAGSMNCACATPAVASTGSAAALTAGATGCVLMAGANGCWRGENVCVEAGLVTEFD